MQDVPATTREALSKRLLAEFKEHPDAGLHGAIDWLLRQAWDKKADLDKIVTDLAQPSRERERPESNAAPVADAPGSKRKDWFVNSQGQTFTIIRGPVTFTMGSPPDEPGREEHETQHRETIARTFAVATRDVTVSEFRASWKEVYGTDFHNRKQYCPDDSCPVIGVTWFQAAQYCRWLSERDGVPVDQMCYPPIADVKEGMKLTDNYLERAGYRLPTEAEWEYACRAGAVTAKPYGRGAELLSHYGWFLNNSLEHAWPCGQLKPNDLGLYDMLGNVWQWCDCSYASTSVYRGGGWNSFPRHCRAAYRGLRSPDFRNDFLGFRIVLIPSG